VHEKLIPTGHKVGKCRSLGPDKNITLGEGRGPKMEGRKGEGGSRQGGIGR